MRLSFLTITFTVLLSAGSLAAFEAVGVVKRVDVENSVLYIFASGKERTVKVDKDAKILGTDGKPLADGLKAKELKEGAEVTVTVERDGNFSIIKAIRIGKQAAVAAKEGKASVGFKPLTEMTAEDKYKGEDGGLYGNGKNEPPNEHLKAAKRETSKIEPLDADGKPAKEGTIALVSISMSNATQEFSLFKQIADRDPKKSPRVTIVDCARAGRPWLSGSIPRLAPGSKRIADYTPRRSARNRCRSFG